MTEGKPGKVVVARLALGRALRLNNTALNHAIDILTRAMVLERTLDDKVLEAEILFELSLLHQKAGNHDASDEFYAQVSGCVHHFSTIISHL